MDCAYFKATSTKIDPYALYVTIPSSDKPVTEAAGAIDSVDSLNESARNRAATCVGGNYTKATKELVYIESPSCIF